MIDRLISKLRTVQRILHKHGTLEYEFSDDVMCIRVDPDEVSADDKARLNAIEVEADDDWQCFILR